MKKLEFMSALLHAYEYAEKTNLVDNHDSDSAVLLPLYHTNLKSNGTNVLMATLNREGKLMRAEYLPKDTSIIFPVTQDSIARSGKNPPSHPLVDKLSYLAPNEEELHQLYKKTFKSWLNVQSEGEIKEYLQIISSFLAQENLLEQLITKVYGRQVEKITDFTVEYKEVSDKGKETIKKASLEAVFLTFQIEDFSGYRTVGVTEFVELHQAYIQYVESLDLPRGVCNISGIEQQLTTKHRGLMGNAKLISVSNNTETYKGRFTSGNDIVKIGYQTSEKIHLMLKYLLENTNSRRWLGGQQYLINWFSDDIKNETELDFVNPFGFDLIEEEVSEQLVSTFNKNIGSSFIAGRKMFTDTSNYYVAIIDKASNGRISLKFFRELETAQLVTNLEKWQSNHQWEYYDQEQAKMRMKVPSMKQMIAAAYGIERNGFLEVDNDNFQKDQFQKLVMNLIDGKSIPTNITKAIGSNIKGRLKYQRTWKQLQTVALGLFHNRNKEDLQPMLDKDNMNRSYLFGRLLAVFERQEAAAFSKTDDKRVTNAQKFWTTYTNHPASTMQILLEKTKNYEKNLLQSKHGLKVKLDREKQEIINALAANYLDSKEMNRALDYHFIFGYYAEEKFIYTKKEDESEE